MSVPSQHRDVFTLRQLRHLMMRLRKLDFGVSEVIEHRFIRERGAQETAKLLNISLSTVNARSRAGLTWLRWHMKN